jgi:hypothetical protein
MAIGKVGGISGSSFVRPIVRRLETDPARRDMLALRGTVVFVDPGQRRFALRHEEHVYNVVWSAATEFIGIGASSMQGAEVSVKGRVQPDVVLAESVVAAR